MAYASALVDRARIHRKSPAPVKVEGRTLFAEVRSAWFRVRLEADADSQSSQPESDVPRTVRTAKLMVAPRDAEGRAVDLRFTDRVEVHSPQLGRAMWEVTQEPNPIRRKRRVIGWEVAVRRVEEQEFDPSGGVAGRTG